MGPRARARRFQRLPFCGNPATEPTPLFHTMSLRLYDVPAAIGSCNGLLDGDCDFAWTMRVDRIEDRFDTVSEGSFVVTFSQGCADHLYVETLLVRRHLSLFGPDQEPATSRRSTNTFPPDALVEIDLHQGLVGDVLLVRQGFELLDHRNRKPQRDGGR
jgi:hypothetical protein